jgi:hypothetical protein
MRVCMCVDSNMCVFVSLSLSLSLCLSLSLSQQTAEIFTLAQHKNHYKKGAVLRMSYVYTYTYIYIYIHV